MLTNEIPVTSNQQLILVALTSTGKHVYAGTVSAKEKARCRAANKVAGKSRRKNRVANNRKGR